nr:hypothetical protein [uncultured Draconibacterium sp.]
MSAKYKIEDDFLFLANGQKVYIPTLEMLCGINGMKGAYNRNAQSGEGNLNIMVGGKNNKVTFEGDIKHSS